MSSGRDPGSEGPRVTSDAGGSPPRGFGLTATDLADAIHLAALCDASARRAPRTHRLGEDPGGPPGDAGHEDGSEPWPPAPDRGADHGYVRPPDAGSAVGAGGAVPTGRKGHDPPAAERPEGPGPPPGSGPGRGTEPPEFVQPVLEGRQDLVAALSPFNLKIPQGVADQVDPEGTARGYARSLLDSLHWSDGERERAGVPVVPVLRARERRAVDLTLLLDEGVTMLFQRGLAGEFAGLLRDSGVFRGVRTLHFDSERTGRPVLRDAQGRSRRLGGRRPTGAHVTLILTDGLGGAWRDRGFQEWVAGAAGDGALAILHLLRPRLWSRGAITTLLTELGVSWPAAAGAPNTRYVRQRTLADLVAEEDEPAAGALVPVLPLKPSAIHEWASFVMGLGRSRLWAHTAEFPGRPGPVLPEAPDAGTGEGFDADQEVLRFQRAATPEAFDLAVALSAVPLDPRLVEAVCEDVMGRATPSELTEVFFSGLVRMRDPSEHGEVRWDFREGVRTSLLARGGRVSDIRRMLGLAAERLLRVDPWFGDLARMLKGEHVVSPTNTVTSRPWVRFMLPAVESAALVRRYSAPIREYAEAARNNGYRDSVASEVWARTTPGLGLSQVPGSAQTSKSDNRKTRNTASFSDRSGETPIMSTNPSIGDRMNDSGEIHTGHTSRSSTSGRPLSAVWVQVPRKNSAFTGREELLSALRAQLLTGQRQVITALNGMSGVGKTELAKEYLHRYASEYDLIVWIPSAHSNQLRESFSVLASRLRLDSAGAGSGHVVEDVLAALHQGGLFQRWLLVYDNAQARTELEQYLPVGGEGHVIITSRDNSWTVAGGDAFLAVQEFERKESIELLKRRGPATLTDDEADALARELGDLPLALNQAAVWLHESGMATEEYLRQFADKSEEMLALLRPDGTYPVAVAAAWNVSLDRLAMTNPAALQMLQLCSFMATSPIPRALFNHARGIDGPPELRAALEDPAKLGMAIRDIGRNSLAHIDHQRNTISLHRLVQRAVQAPMGEAEREEMRHCAHQLLGRSDLQDVSTDAGRFTDLLPHVWAAQAWDCEDPWVRAVVVQMCRMALLRQEFDDARRLGDTAWAWWREHLGENHPSTLSMAVQVAVAMRGQGHLAEALQLGESTLATLRELQNPEDPETLEAEIEHIRSLRFVGRFRDSLTAAADAYHRRVRLFGEEDPHTLLTAHFRAFNLLLSGDPAASAEQYRDTLTRLEIVFGPDHGRTLGTNNGYAEALMERGLYREAEAIQTNQVERVTSLLDEDDPGVLSNVRTLAVMRRRIGRHREAFALSEKAWQRFRIKQGADSNDTMYAALVHSMSLSAVDQHDEALELAQTTGERYVKLLGDQHPYVGAANINQAIILRRLGRVAEARELDERALVLFRERIGGHHPSALSCLVNLANDHFLTGDVAGARELDEEALAGCTRELGPRHPLTLLARRNLLVDRRAQGEDVDPEFIEVEDQYREAMGADHPATLSIRKSVRGDADIYLAQM